MDNEYLAHHGVKGMKWGVRKDRGPKTGRRRSPNVQGGLRVVGRGVAAGGRMIGRGIAAGGRAVASVPGRVSAVNAAHKKKEALEAIKRGDVDTVKKNLKYVTADEIHATLDRINAEKRLMSEIDKNRERTGAEKVTEALNGIGNSRVANAVKKGAAEGLQDVTKTVVKGVATDSSDTASKAVGSGIGSAFTAWALYKTVGGDAPDYRNAFKTGVTESLRRSAKDKYSLDLATASKPDTSGRSSSKQDSGPKTSEQSAPKQKPVELKDSNLSSVGVKSGSSYKSVSQMHQEQAQQAQTQRTEDRGRQVAQSVLSGYDRGYTSATGRTSKDAMAAAKSRIDKVLQDEEHKK